MTTPLTSEQVAALQTLLDCGVLVRKPSHVMDQGTPSGFIEMIQGRFPDLTLRGDRWYDRWDNDVTVDYEKIMEPLLVDFYWVNGDRMQDIRDALQALPDPHRQTQERESFQ